MSRRKMSLYPIVPTLEAASCILRAAAALWHPVKRREQKKILLVARDMGSKAEDLRKQGIGWMPREVFSDGPTVLVSGHPHRSHHSEGIVPPRSPRDGVILLETLNVLLARFDPAFERMEEEHHDEQWLAEWFFGHRETILEIAPRESGEVSEEAERSFDLYAVLLECEMLAYIQARAEDALSDKTGKIKKKKPERSDEEIARLAEDIGMSFEDVKAVFSREYSSWWDVSRKFAERATLSRDRFIDLVGAIDAETVRAAWKNGSAFLNNTPYSLYGDEVEMAGKIATLMIEMLLAFPGGEDARHAFRKTGRLMASSKRLEHRS